MSCTEIEENMYDYLSGRASTEMRSAIDEHLASCPACRKELDDYKITLGLLDYIKPPKVSEGFTERVMQSLEPKVIPFTRRPVYRLIMQGAVAAIVVLAVVSIIKLMPTSTTTPDTSTTRGTSGITENCRKAIELYNKGTATADLKQKEALLQQALAAGCTDNKVLARIHNNVADCSEQQGRLDDALAGYSKALELDPELYIAYIGMGDVYKKQGQAQAAITQYKKALSLLEAAATKDKNIQKLIEGLKREMGNFEK